MITTGIYKITSPKGQVYIGQSVNIHKRWNQYKSGDMSNQKKLYASIIKYGYINHVFEVIHECEANELNALESYYISVYKKIGGLNMLNMSQVDVREKNPEHIKKQVRTNKDKRYSKIKSINYINETTAEIIITFAGNEYIATTTDIDTCKIYTEKSPTDNLNTNMLRAKSGRRLISYVYKSQRKIKKKQEIFEIASGNYPNQ